MMKKSGFTSKSVGTVSAVFFSKTDADNIYRTLLRRGHTADDIGVLMSDETLNQYQVPGEGNMQLAKPDLAPESALARAAKMFSAVIISVSSMISLPGLGRAISKKLQKKFPADSDEIKLKEPSHVVPVGTGAEPQQTHRDRMSEGGIIVSVDPRDKEEKNAIIEDFRRYNGHDILGDDGYTELDQQTY